MSKLLRDNVELVGSPTLSNHILSNFGTYSYGLFRPKFRVDNVSSFIINIHIKTTSSGDGRVINGQQSGSADSTTGPTIANGWGSNSIRMFFKQGSTYNEFTAISTTTINTDYWYRWEYDGSNVRSYYSTDGITYTLNETKSPTISLNFSSEYFTIGEREGDHASGNVYPGLVYLEDCNITVNGMEYWTGTSIVNKFYVPARKGTNPKFYIPTREVKSVTYNFRTNGSPTVTDGHILSNFSSSNYGWFQTKEAFQVGDVETYEIINKIKMTSSPNSYSRPMQPDGSGGSDSTEAPTVDVTSANGLQLFWYDGSNWYSNYAKSYDASDINKWLWVKWTYDANENNGTFRGYYSYDGVNYTLNEETHLNVLPRFTKMQYKIGNRNGGGSVFYGQVDVAGIKINVNGHDIYNGISERNYLDDCGYAGKPFYTDGCVYALDDNNYIIANKLALKQDGELMVHFFLGNITAQSSIIVCEGLFYIEADASNINTYSVSGRTSYNIVSSYTKYRDYWVKIIFSGNTQEYYWSTDGENFTLGCSFTNTSTGSYCTLGRHSSLNGRPLTNASIYLEDCYFKVNSQVYWSGKISEAKKGMLIDMTQNNGSLTDNMEFTGASGAWVVCDRNIPLNTANSWEIQTKYLYRGGGNSPTVFGYSTTNDYQFPVFLIEQNKFKLLLSSNGSSWNLNGSASSLTPVKGDMYYFKVGFTGSEYYIDYNNTGWNDNFSRVFSIQSSTKVYIGTTPMFMNMRLNGITSQYYAYGPIYLPDTKIIINGNVYWKATESITKYFIPTRDIGNN